MPRTELLLFFEIVEVCSVHVTLDLWKEWRLVFAHVAPVDAPEEWMYPYLWEGEAPLGGANEFEDEVLRLTTEPGLWRDFQRSLVIDNFSASL